MEHGKLYLIPNFLANDSQNDFLPEMVKRMTHHLKNFVVESEKEARALIKKLQLATPQNELQIFILNEHTEAKTYHHLLKALEKNQDAGIISDAGLPCVADPGFQLVALAHQKNISVIPLPGSSSIFMALMASGFSGQNFAFTGYLPIDKSLRIKRIKELERELTTKQQAQIFMETPYRNNHLFDDLVKNCNANVLLCIACNISASDELIKTKPIKEWAKLKPDLHKKPTIFILGN
ncbi:MAG: SAM-dependent methyltransferase [Bacteroidota bacterium]|jgi:16S rRNA (cytidine1402-2'-O)-methyltransferase